MSHFDTNTANKHVLTSYLLNLSFRTQGDTGIVYEAAIWYMWGTWKWTSGSYSKRLNKMQSVWMRCLCTGLFEMISGF